MAVGLVVIVADGILMVDGVVGDGALVVVVVARGVGCVRVAYILSFDSVALVVADDALGMVAVADGALVVAVNTDDVLVVRIVTDGALVVRVVVGDVGLSVSLLQ